MFFFNDKITLIIIVYFLSRKESCIIMNRFLPKTIIVILLLLSTILFTGCGSNSLSDKQYHEFQGTIMEKLDNCPDVCSGYYSSHHYRFKVKNDNNEIYMMTDIKENEFKDCEVKDKITRSKNGEIVCTKDNTIKKGGINQ